jgi:hypothetical protein
VRIRDEPAEDLRHEPVHRSGRAKTRVGKEEPREALGARAEVIGVRLAVLGDTCRPVKDLVVGLANRAVIGAGLVLVAVGFVPGNAHEVSAEVEVRLALGALLARSVSVQAVV